MYLPTKREGHTDIANIIVEGIAMAGIDKRSAQSLVVPFTIRIEKPQ